MAQNLYDKDFDKAEFDRSDPVGRKIATDLAEKGWGMHVIGNADPYGADLCVFAGGKLVFFLEVAVRYNWKNGTISFPFSTVNIERRKQKYWDRAGKTPVMYMVISGDKKGIIYTVIDDITKFPLKFKTNKKMPDGEYLFEVPLDLFEYTEVKDET